MLEYTGIIKQVRFYSEETKFIVCVIDSEQEDKPILATGYMSYVNPQDKYHFQGDYIIHPKYGKQFQIQSYEIILADDESEIIRYLSSSLFKGIGEKQATAIVETLGKDALNKIKEDKHVLDQVRGMNEKKRETIAEVLSSQDFDQEVLSFFMGHGISTKHLALIQAVYQEHTLDILQNNPYQLIDDIDGIGFKTADDLALKIGVDPLDENRIKAAILYALKEACFQDGSTFHEHDIIFKRFHRYIPAISYEQFDDYLDQLLEEKKIIQDVEKYYPYDLYESEVTICQTFKRFIDAPLYQYEDEEVEQLLNDLQQQLSIEYDDLQKEAIHLFLKQSAMILTGGPGTGKTTIVEAIMKLYTKLNPDQSIALVAPTGRAAKRLSEVTGLEACTIHRLLKWDLHTNTFAINAQNPLDVDLLVIDEFSMVDTLLFSNLLSASRKVSKILLIGDDQQLPSVAPGHVLKDLLDCEMVPTVRLNRIYRQSQESGIVQLAHSIRNDQYDENLFFEYKDIHFQTCASYDVVKYVQVLVSKAMKEGYDANDIQVLAPMYNGVAGIDALNDCLQDLLNPHDEFKNELRVGKRIYREGDKILQLKNRIEDNVFNGDIGTLVEICYKDNFEYLTDTLIVDFDGTYVEYTANDFYTITHAYCMSIHKSQGNEFKIVIMPVLKDYYIMLRKNLIYTGLTRAKQSLFVIGNHQSFQYGIANNHDEKRRTTLKEKMLDTPTLSPYDFM
ncbi:MAG: ATP-dependent RecD-like DNA helicase [Longibaculum muris]|uniref:SF1B family DNA helicase RecD2 n=1 Tax=Longibaculum muris TaxID=1796628 RepID=UPI000797B931|nr:ATP-dependent RecD-like DNA helicase [Longibaculum muris]KXU46462.1 helicase, RecD/TraA family [Candidatus Stoquefichus sp. KLE1796]MBS5369449.1 ATP-dependent RecD-like DNA helicase [Coprobacillus cateniformis]MED9811016.1 ATP-dependent RecD-like DNA helicase [Longibaculum muris]